LSSGKSISPAGLASGALVRPVMPELDTLRGIACLAVVFLHGFAWRYGTSHFSRPQRTFMLLTQPGWMGVNLFFVLSGFLITGILIDSKQRRNYYQRFYTRRALRILPACYLLLLVLGIIGSASWSFVGLGFLYMANMTSFFGVSMDYGPLWSLAVEEHYYILWPALVRKLTLRGIAIAAAVIFLGTPLLRGVAFYTGHPAGIDWYTWFVADGLAMGSLLAVALRTTITRRQTIFLSAGLMSFAAGAAVVGRPFGLLTRQRLMGAALQYTFIHIFFAGVLLLFLIAGTSQYRGWVNNKILQFFGYISYGLYLFHWLVFHLYDKFCGRYWPQWAAGEWHFGLVVLRFTISLLVATGVTYLSRRYYEEAFLRLKDRFGAGRRAALEKELENAVPVEKEAVTS
jgi:peptidoglycan/LPS O-acetylase OafA/YrhL